MREQAEAAKEAGAQSGRGDGCAIPRLIAAREAEDEVIYHGMRWLWQDPDKTMAQLAVGDVRPVAGLGKGHLLGYGGDLRRRFEQALKTMKRWETYQRVLRRRNRQSWTCIGKPRVTKDGKPVHYRDADDRDHGVDRCACDRTRPSLCKARPRSAPPTSSARLKRAMTVAARDELLEALPEGTTPPSIKDQIVALAAQKLDGGARAERSWPAVGSA